MAKVVPPAPRARVSEDWEGLRVVVPVWRNWFILLLTPFWLVVWVAGEMSAIGMLLSGEAHGALFLFLIAWLCGWTAGGAGLLFTWLWYAVGCEEISVRDDALSVRYSVFDRGKTWEFDPCAVRDLRVIYVAYPPSAWWSAWWDWAAYDTACRNTQGYWKQIGIWSGPFAFDYGAKTFRFGAGVDEAEARQLLPQLLRRLSPGDGR